MYLINREAAERKRRASNLTHQQWADLAGVHRCTVTHVLNGRHATFETAWRLSYGLKRAPALPAQAIDEIFTPASRRGPKEAQT